MLNFIAICILAVCATAAFAAQDVAGVIAGTVKNVDRTSKVVVIKTADGAEHAFHYAGDLAVHGGDVSRETGDRVLHDVTKGSRVAVHYTTEGDHETVHEIDNLGDRGLKVMKGVVTHVDSSTRTIALKAANGTEETLKVSGRGMDDAGSGIGEGTEKAERVSIYYTEEAGKKTAHFIERL